MTNNGYYVDLGPGTSSEAGRENPFLAGGNDVSLERLRAEAAELARQATRSSVTIFAIAVEKKTAYIKLDGGEYRLLVRKTERKK